MHADRGAGAAGEPGWEGEEIPADGPGRGGRLKLGAAAVSGRGALPNCDDREVSSGSGDGPGLRKVWCLSRVARSSNRTSSFSQSPFPAYRPAAPHGQGPGWKAAAPRRRFGVLLPLPPQFRAVGGKECGRPPPPKKRKDRRKTDKNFYFRESVGVLAAGRPSRA